MVARRFRRLLAGRYIDLRESARRSIVLCPNETTTVPPAIYDPLSLERVEGLSPWRSWEFERRLMSGGPIEHHATIAHEIDRVDVVDAFMYAGAAKSQPGFGAERLLLQDAGRRVDIERAVLTTSNAGSHYFGNFLRDDMPLALLAADSEGEPIALANRGYPHEAEYRRLLCAPAGTPLRRARVGRLTMFTDFGQNSLKEARYRALRAHLRRSAIAAGALRRGAPRGIYIRRGRTGELRLLVNEAEVERILVAHGFRVIDLETMDSPQIAELALDARIVVSVEGSQLAHGMYCAADDAVFLVLQPPQRLSMVYKEYTDRMGMGFAFVVGEPWGDGFQVPADDLQRALDRLSKWW
jgi:capsular polysaccharide biosynthesis protein